MKRRYSSRNTNKSGKLCVMIIVLAIAGVMSVQIVNLYEKNQAYIAREAELNEQKEAELNRKAELEAYDAYTDTQEYVEDTAKSKLGMVYEDEIVFKER